MNRLFPRFAACSILFLLLACGKEPGQKSSEIDYSAFGRLLPGRTNHTAIWTGSKMIVFGGFTKGGGSSQTPNQFPGDYTTSNDVISYDPAADSWHFIKTVGTSIIGHSAVWTEAEMIEWGGVTSPVNASPVVTNAGMRYNPSTDIWTTMTTTGAPSARRDQTALWTGNEMLIWGGTTDPNNPATCGCNCVSNSIVSNGARFNPAVNNWTSMSTASALSGRAGYTAVWTGTEMIIWGGQDINNNVFNTGARYNPATNIWSSMSMTNAPTARALHVAIWTGSAMIVFGGLDHNCNALYDGAKYDPAADTWTSIASLTSSGNFNPYQYLSGVWTGTELIVWTGDGLTWFNDAAAYNPSTNSWKMTGILNNSMDGRAAASMLWTGSETIVWGGMNAYHGDVNGYRLYNTGTKYDPSSGSVTYMSIFIK